MEERAKSGPVVELSGNRRAVVDGCDGIVDYSEEVVLLRAGKLFLRMEGRGLRLKRLTEDSAVVEGFLTRVEYTREYPGGKGE